MSEIYNAALDLVAESGIAWEDSGSDFRVLLLKATPTPVFDATHATLKAVLDHADNVECDDASYGRYTIPDEDRTVENGTRQRQFHIANSLNFGALDNETPGAAILYLHKADVADPDDASIPIAMLTGSFPASNGSGYVIPDPPTGLFYVEGTSS